MPRPLFQDLEIPRFVSGTSRQADATTFLWDIKLAYAVWNSMVTWSFPEATTLQPRSGAYQPDSACVRFKVTSVKFMPLPLMESESQPGAWIQVYEYGIPKMGKFSSDVFIEDVLANGSLPNSVLAKLFCKVIHPLSASCKCVATHL